MELTICSIMVSKRSLNLGENHLQRRETLHLVHLNSDQQRFVSNPSFVAELKCSIYQFLVQGLHPCKVDELCLELLDCIHI